MNEYKFTVEREFTGKVKDIYTIAAESKEKAIEQFKEIAESPSDMVMLPHDTYIEDDNINYCENASVTIQYMDDDVPFDFDIVEQVNL